MFVILDTTEFFDAPRADSNSFTVLREFLRRTHSRLIVPEVVVKELVNHVRERLAKVDSQLQDAETDYERVRTLGAAPLRITRPDFSVSLRTYEGSIRAKLRQLFYAEILPVPTVPHEQVIERALQRKKPFVANKDGYRDTLIWLSIVTRITEQPGEYIFITNNQRDFSEKELTSELGQLPEGCTLCYEHDLKSFIDKRAKGALQQLNALADRLRADLTLPGIDLREELSNPSSDALQQMSSKLKIRKHAYRSIEEPYYIESYDTPHDIQVNEVYGVEEETMVECSAAYDCTIEGFLFRSEAYGLSKEQGIHVVDWDWNEHYCEVEFSETVQTRLLLRLAQGQEDPAKDEHEYSLQSIEILEAAVNEDEL